MKSKKWCFFTVLSIVIVAFMCNESPSSSKESIDEVDTTQNNDNDTGYVFHPVKPRVSIDQKSVKYKGKEGVKNVFEISCSGTAKGNPKTQVRFYFISKASEMKMSYTCNGWSKADDTTMCACKRWVFEDSVVSWVYTVFPVWLYDSELEERFKIKAVLTDSTGMQVGEDSVWVKCEQN